MTTLAPLGFGAFGGQVAGQAGSTIGTASYLANIVDGDLGEITESREDIEFTNSQSPYGYRQFNPGDLVDGGEYELDLLFNTQATSVPWGVTETITITLPKRGNAVTAATISFPGYLKKHATKMPSKDKMTVKVTLKVAGLVTRTPAA